MYMYFPNLRTKYCIPEIKYRNTIFYTVYPKTLADLDNRAFTRGNEKRISIEKGVSFFCLQSKEDQRTSSQTFKVGVFIFTQGERNS